MWKKAVFGTASAGFLGFVVWLSCLSSAPHQIEWDVATRVIDVLDRTGFGEIVPVVDGRDVELTSYEYNTLEYLMMHRQKVVSKTELTNHLYEQDFDRDSNVIEVFIRRLRKKLDPDSERNPITTQRGMGYRFNADAVAE